MSRKINFSIGTAFKLKNHLARWFFSLKAQLRIRAASQSPSSEVL
jgi:hypothetical protein